LAVDESLGALLVLPLPAPPHDNTSAKAKTGNMKRVLFILLLSIELI
jgi:hypothetical protein